MSAGDKRDASKGAHIGTPRFLSLLHTAVLEIPSKPGFRYKIISAFWSFEEFDLRVLRVRFGSTLAGMIMSGILGWSGDGGGALLSPSSCPCSVVVETFGPDGQNALLWRLGRRCPRGFKGWYDELSVSKLQFTLVLLASGSDWKSSSIQLCCNNMGTLSLVLSAIQLESANWLISGIPMRESSSGRAVPASDGRISSWLFLLYSFGVSGKFELSATVQCIGNNDSRQSVRMFFLDKNIM